MVHVIITGHGHFASGMLSALKLIAGEQEHISGIDFLESHSTKDLSELLEQAIQQLVGNQVVILTDLLGGSPFQESVVIKSKSVDVNIEVIAGCNFPMLLTCAFSREIENAQELAQLLVKEGKKAVNKFKIVKPEYNTEEGI